MVPLSLLITIILISLYSLFQTQTKFYGAMAELVKRKRGTDLESLFLDDGGVVISAMVPWQEVVCGKFRGGGYSGYCSVPPLSFFIWSGALDSSDFLLSYLLTSLSSRMTRPIY